MSELRHDLRPDPGLDICRRRSRGFFLTGFGGFFGMDGETLILFGINPAHNIVHLILGVTYLIGARASEAGARAVVLVLSSAYLLVGVLGLILIDTNANILAINQADNVLHLAGGAIGIGVVAASTRRGPQPAGA